ncbi:MAG: hypothetical protein BWY40_01263 [bacterium ADurb.Bin270]|nr:MAG: hypothetical protein BWY40_01263 [bacterium ADurb.Bin270]HQG13433.1 hypothetical protein [bacterium]
MRFSFGEEGFAALEIAVAAPLAALFIVIVMQFAGIFHAAMKNISDANLESSLAAQKWEIANALNGMNRPCIERSGADRYNSRNLRIPTGVGDSVLQTFTGQGVLLYYEDICDD